MHFANQALLISIATMLWSLDIKPLTDENNAPVAPDIQWEDDGLIVCAFISFLSQRLLKILTLVISYRKPAPFSCQFSPRFAGVQEILSDVYSDC
jgi:hypothetical protein